LPSDFRKPVPFDAEVEGRLQIQPELGAVSKVEREAHGRIRGDGPLAFRYLVDSARRNTQSDGELVLCDSQRSEKFFGQYLARMDGAQFRHGFLSFLLSVIIDNLDLICVSFLPFEANTPLKVHANRILPITVPHELFEMVGWRNFQILEAGRGCRHFELPPGDAFDINETADAIASRQLFCVLAAEGPDHKTIV
jgi:hypothetical protein